MQKFEYVGDDVRVFPDVSLEATPGEVYELAANPDPSRFRLVEDDKSKKAPKE